MAIDTSMYSRLQPVDIFGSIQRGLEMRDLMDQSAQKQKDIKKQQIIQEATNAGIKTGPDGRITQDVGLTASQLHNAGYGQEALKFQDEQQTKSADKILKEAQLIGQTLGSVYDSTSWESAKAKLSQSGIDISQYANVPYDEKLKDNLLYRTMSAEKQLQHKLDQEKLALQKREVLAKERSSGGGSGFGKAPQGYRFKQDGSLEPIPGGPAAGKAEKQAQMEKHQASLVVQDLGRAMQMTNAAGPIAGQLSYVPGSEAWQLDQMLDSVKANIGFDKLQAMRNASPTGGALGSISDKETAMLQATAGKLDVRLPQPVLEDNLKRLYNQYNDIVHGPGKGPKRQKLSFDEQGKPLPQSSIFMKAPSGREYQVPAANVQEAKRYGATEVGSAPVLKTNQIEWAD